MGGEDDEESEEKICICDTHLEKGINGQEREEITQKPVDTAGE